MANTQLTRIVAPNINEVDYAKKMQDVFNNINENFAKIASLPFIQGVQGDSYQLVEKPIWQKNGTGIDNIILTKDGALLLGSIFKTSFSVGTTFNNVRTNLRELTINNVNPIDFFKDSEGNITNNILYFYAVINDSGKEEEKQLGQYYYFVDARLKVLGDVYYGTDNSILSSFTDYTGFYQYIPAIGSDPEKYDKISILPSLYYDQYKDDICWKFNGNESGVSAIGVKGMDGKDSSLQIVHVTLNENQTISNTTSGTVKGVFKFNKTNTEPIWNTNPTDISNLVEGNAIISITDISSNTVYLAYGEIKKEKVDEKDKIVAYWNLDTVIDKLAYGTINSYFYDMRNVDSIPANTPRYIAIPAITGATAASVSAHTISNAVKDPADLKFQYAPDVFTGPDSSQKKLLDDSADENGNIKRKAIFENYNVEIKKGDLDIPTGKIRIGTTDGVGTITNTGSIVGINYTTNEDVKASLKIGVVGPKNEGTVTVNPKLKVDGNLTVTDKTSLNGGADLSGTILFKNTGNIKVESVKQITGGGCPSGAGHFWRGKENAFILHDGYNSDDIFYPVVTVKATNDGAYYSMGAWMDNLILEYIPEAVHDKIKKTDTAKNNLVKSIKFNHDSTGINVEVSGKATINNGATIYGGLTVNNGASISGKIEIKSVQEIDVSTMRDSNNSFKWDQKSAIVKFKGNKPGKDKFIMRYYDTNNVVENQIFIIQNNSNKNLEIDYDGTNKLVLPQYSRKAFITCGAVFTFDNKKYKMIAPL